MRCHNFQGHRNIKRPITGIPIIGLKLSHYARRMILLGSLSIQPRGNFSIFTGKYYMAGYVGYQRIILNTYPLNPG